MANVSFTKWQLFHSLSFTNFLCFFFSSCVFKQKCELRCVEVILFCLSALTVINKHRTQELDAGCEGNSQKSAALSVEEALI